MDQTSVPLNQYLPERKREPGIRFLRHSEHSKRSRVVVYHRLLSIQDGKTSEFATTVEPLVRAFKEKIVLCPRLFSRGPVEPSGVFTQPSGAEYAFVYPEFISTVSYYSYALTYSVLSGRRVEEFGVVEFLRANPGRWKEVMLQLARDPQFPRPPRPHMQMPQYNLSCSF